MAQMVIRPSTIFNSSVSDLTFGCDLVLTHHLDLGGVTEVHHVTFYNPVGSFRDLQGLFGNCWHVGAHHGMKWQKH